MKLQKSPVYLRQGNFEVRLAETLDELRRAQNLRHRAFFPSLDPHGFDEDAVDPVADHLIALDHDSIDSGGQPKLVGTYRLMRARHARELGKWYSSDEFDLGFLDQLHGEELELGRSCVDDDYRKSGVITLMWLCLGGYVAAYDIEILFGCGSFSGVDPAPHAQTLSYLHHFLAPPAGIDVPVRGESVSTNLIAEADIDKRQSARELPALIRGYAQLGAWFSQQAYVDRDFNVLDVLVCVATENSPERYHKRFKRAEFVRPEYL